MTDNQSNAIEKQPKNNPSQNTQVPNKDVAVQKSTQSGASTSSTSSQANVPFMSKKSYYRRSLISITMRLI